MKMNCFDSIRNFLAILGLVLLIVNHHQPLVSGQFTFPNFGSLSSFIGGDTGGGGQANQGEPQPGAEQRSGQQHFQLNLVPNQQQQQFGERANRPMGGQFGPNEHVMRNIKINPAEISFVAPDNVPSEVGQQIIAQIRQSLGNQPIAINDLNGRNVSFQAELPGVSINRTVLTNIEETSVNKTTRMALPYGSGPAPYPPTTVHYASPPPPAPPAAPYTNSYPSSEQKSMTSNQAYMVQQSYQSNNNPNKPATVSSSYTALPTLITYSKSKSPPPPPSAAYKQAEQPGQYGQKEPEKVKIVYKYIEVCNNKNYYNPSDPAAPSYNDPGVMYDPKEQYSVPELNYGSIELPKLDNSVGDMQKAVLEGYKELDTVYAKIRQSLANLNQLQSIAKEYQAQAQYPIAPPQPYPPTQQYQAPPPPPQAQKPAQQYASPPPPQPHPHPQPAQHYPAPAAPAPAQYRQNYQQQPHPPPPPPPQSQYKNLVDGNNLKVSYQKEEETLNTNNGGAAPAGGGYPY